jgi:hypothetical protein
MLDSGAITDVAHNRRLQLKELSLLYKTINSDQFSEA